MTSHLDIARKELMKQRSVLRHEITELERALKKVERALVQLEPVEKPKMTKRYVGRANSMESVRRREVLDKFIADRNGTPFNEHDVVEQMHEDQQLANSYYNLLRELVAQGKIEVAVRGIKGKQRTTYRAKQSREVAS